MAGCEAFASPLLSAGVDGVLGRCSSPAGVRRSLSLSQLSRAERLHTPDDSRPAETVTSPATFQTQKEKEALERRCVEDMAALTFQAQQREHELTQTLQQMEAQHETNGGCPLAYFPLPNNLLLSSHSPPSSTPHQEHL
ncbi:serologically defined colon cancer antigen 8 homolog isoform X1 [Tachysurus ichikawai]